MYNKNISKGVGDRLLKVFCTNIEKDFSDLPGEIFMLTEMFENDIRKKEYLAGRYLALKGLREIGFTEDIEFKIQSGGKVYVENASDFSISHDGGIAVCAFSTGLVGADVVFVERFLKSKPHRYFTDTERIIVGADAKKNALLWSVKEAYGKMTAEGLNKKICQRDFREIFSEESLPYGLYVNNVFVWTVEKNGCIITVCTSEKSEPEFVFDGI